MAHVKGTSTTSLGRDSHGQRLGIKLFAGEYAKSGSIIVRQRGTKFFPGRNVLRGKDDTLFAVKAGTVKFLEVKKLDHSGKPTYKKYVHVIPA